jgi:recombination endonuclease VII
VPNDNAAKDERLRYRVAHPDRVTASRTLYRTAHPDRVKASKNHPPSAKAKASRRIRDARAIAKRTQIRQKVLAFQKGECAVCKEPLPFIVAGDPWAGSQLDHEHNNPLCTHSQSGDTRSDTCIRGALCRGCNMVLAHTEKRNRLDLLADAFRTYLADPPYQQMLRLA